MRHVIVRYTVAPDRIEENERLVRDVFEELRATAPAGVRYACYHEGEGRFVHVASLWAPEGHNPIGATAAFQRFQAGLAGRCVSPPEATDVHEVGRYAAAVSDDQA